jgi:hypothetical protein
LAGNIATFNNLAVGSYTFNVTDANGVSNENLQLTQLLLLM